MKIPFNQVHITGKEKENILKLMETGRLSGDGVFTNQCHSWLEKNTKANKALLVHSCTAALEMSALLMDLKPGDEVIMPSYTFVSTANAFVLRGAVPVFIDIRPDTLNMDENLIEQAITDKTRAIVPVHYAGVACEMDSILRIAGQYNLFVVEDAAQGVGCTYKGKSLGAIGDFGTYSFHESKNIVSGEGGALLINNPDFAERAEILREKGTNRSQFFRGEVDKYTWKDMGSSYLPSELVAAMLIAQLEESSDINNKRLKAWDAYHTALSSFEFSGKLRRPVIPGEITHNAHMYFILLPSLAERTRVMKALKEKGVSSVFHYVPLHSSEAGKKYGRVAGKMSYTDDLSDRLLRLPMWPGVDVDYVLNALHDVLA